MEGDQFNSFMGGLATAYVLNTVTVGCVHPRVCTSGRMVGGAHWLVHRSVQPSSHVQRLNASPI